MNNKSFVSVFTLTEFHLLLLLGAFSRITFGIDLLDVICADEATGTVLNNPDSCTTFYYCQNETVVEYECQGGLYFDPVAMSCQPQKLNDPYCGPCNNLLDGDLVKLAGSCGRYGVCENKIVVEERYCEENEYFDSREFQCKINSEIKCDKRCDNLKTPFMADPSDCRNYLQCEGGQVVTKVCPDGLYFDVKRLLCGYETDVKCA